MSINSKNTKAEILAAYKELEKQSQDLESQLKQRAQQKQVAPVAVTMKPVASKHDRQKDRHKDQNLTVTIESLETIQGGFGGAVSNLSEQLISEATELETVRQAIAEQTEDLASLYQLTDIDESTMDFLLDQYQASTRKFTLEYEEQQESDRQEIEAWKQKWLKETQTHQKAISVRDENYRQERQREQEEYQYNLDLARDLEESEYMQLQKLQQQELAENLQQLERQWAQKEAEIAQQEGEYQIAAEKVAAFETQLRAKIKQGTEEGKGIGTYQTKVKTDLRNREIEGQQQNYQLQIESLEQTIKHQAIRINKLSQQLDHSLQQVQNLAVKAIEGTSSRNSFEAMKAIALEQAKTPQKGK